MPYKIIFFDLDGTIINAHPGLIKSIQYALKKSGIDESKTDFSHFIGPPMHESFQKYYGFDLTQSNQAVEYFREHYMIDGINKHTLYNGISDLLHRLKKADKKLFIVTAKPKDQAQMILAAHKLDTLFEAIVASKPHFPDLDKQTLIKQALLMNPDESKESIVMVGDRDFDIVGAKANDIDSIGVLYGFGGIEEISNIQPTHIAKSVEDLEKYL